jgi:UDP-3-O-acyl N-acetylglucosamine deacetylase
MVHRQTIAREASFFGLGLFSAQPATVVVRPATSLAGIVFRRGGRNIPALIDHLSREPAHTCMPAVIPGRNTTIAGGGVGVATIEHLMSALAGLGITDAVVEIDGPEVPILDGGALPMVEGMKRAGMAVLEGPYQPFVLTVPVQVLDATGGQIVAMPRPSPGFSLTYELNYGPDSPIRLQSARWEGDPDRYAEEIAPARTFCLRKEAEAMRRWGLFSHLTPKEMLVVGDDGKPIENEWRFSDEPARHKLLDLIGDLALLGRPIQADIVASRSGHALTHTFVKQLASSGGV